jgi:hypothetical protein
MANHRCCACIAGLVQIPLFYSDVEPHNPGTELSSNAAVTGMLQSAPLHQLVVLLLLSWLELPHSGAILDMVASTAEKL